MHSSENNAVDLEAHNELYSRQTLKLPARLIQNAIQHDKKRERTLNGGLIVQQLTFEHGL